MKAGGVYARAEVVMAFAGFQVFDNNTAWSNGGEVLFVYLVVVHGLVGAATSPL